MVGRKNKYTDESVYRTAQTTLCLSLLWDLQIVKCAHGEWTPCIFHMPSEVLHIGITAQYGIFTIIQANKE
jgi:hypothetical protein